MIIERDNKKYKVLKQVGGEIQVEDEFNYYDKPHKRMIKMWWDLKDCKIIKS